MRLALMITCMGDVLAPQVGRATVGVLRRLGHEVDFPEAQTCCGQPFFNSGYNPWARQQAQQTIETFAAAEAVVVPSGSCAAMMKVEYPQLLADDRAWHERANELAAKTFELGDLLVNRLKVIDVGARFAGTVTYHYSCHLRGLGLTGEAEQLIRQVACVTFVPLPRLELCCGFGGSFAIRYPQISGAMVDDKVRAITSTGAEVVVATDTGCLMNIGGRLHRVGSPIRTMHLAELLASQ